MSHDNAKHEKVRFSREDHRDLNRFPSAKSHQRRHVLRRGLDMVHGVSKLILILIGTLLFAIFCLVGLLATVGISNSYFSTLVQTSLQRIAGPDVLPKVLDARLSLDSAGNLAFAGKNIQFSSAKTGSELAAIGTLRIGLQAWPLLFGKTEIARLELSDVTIKSSSDTPLAAKFLGYLKREDGLFDPGKVAPLIHQSINSIYRQLEARGAQEVLINNLTFSGQASAAYAPPKITSLQLRKQTEGAIAFTSELVLNSKTLQLKGDIDRSNFDVSLVGLKYNSLKNIMTEADLADASKPIPLNGDMDVRMRGRVSSASPSVQFDFELSRFDYRNRRGARILGDAKVSAMLVGGVEKVEILPSQIRVGNNNGTMSGAIGLEPSSTSQAPSYRFELVSNNVSLQPQDSPEARLSAALRIAGKLNAEVNEVSFTQLGLRTLSGQLYGQGNIKLGAGSPEIIFSLTIPEIAVAHAKQLWPSIFAGAARNWVLDHVFGGRLTNSTINVAYRAGSLWPTPNNGPMRLPTSDEISADFTVNNVRFDVIGEMPPVRDAQGSVSVRGADTLINVNSGTAFLEGGKTVEVSSGVMQIPVVAGRPVIGQLAIDVSGDAAIIAEVANRDPINALSKAPIQASDLSGSAIAHIEASFPLRKVDRLIEKKWNADVEFKNLSIAKEFNGQKLTDADGTLSVSKTLANFKAKGKLNGIPASLEVVEPLGQSAVKREVSARLTLDDNARAKLMPGLKDILTGPVDIGLAGESGSQKIEADLTKASLNLPWAGWSKGSGIPAKATFEIEKSKDGSKISNLDIRGRSFSIQGDVDISGSKFVRANFSNVSLNQGDQVSIKVVNGKDGFDVNVAGRSLDLRALLKRVTGSFEKTAATTGGVPIRVKANIDSVTGFNDEQLQNIVANYSGKGSTIRSFTASANSNSGANIAIENRAEGNQRSVLIQTADGGALLRFMDIYTKMAGGKVNVSLTTTGDGPLTGDVDARDFTIVGEPRLKSLVGAPVRPGGESLSKVAKNKLNVSRVKFERGNAFIQKGKGYLKLDRGILRSDQIGLSYSGTVYDQNGRINMVGTFMPAFGLNRLFSELPIFGELLGNGRDKGLIGITFKLAGNAKSPELTVNPMSLIAPGIFRQIFEFQ